MLSSMKETISNEPHLALADRHIALAEERIREQMRQLLNSTARGDDTRCKSEFVLLLIQSLSSMRRYRAYLSTILPKDGETASAVGATPLAATSAAVSPQSVNTAKGSAGVWQRGELAIISQAKRPSL